MVCARSTTAASSRVIYGVMGERFGNYELLEKVAVGGMAEIFKARAVHGQGVEKLVCIKRIHPALSADRLFVAMFIDEARLGVTMAHGNIVPTFDFGYVDGHYFLAMEYVEGHDLASLAGRAKVVGIEWPHQLAIYVVMSVLEGLGYAHNKRDEQGRPLKLVHRDVSPSNVLVSNDGQVELLDFGIARSQAREFETRTGVIKGKPGYMSPEQAAGGEVDARADVWSCGAVLHELITGTRLKDGRKKVEDELIEMVIDRALAANRDNRFSDAGSFQRALADVLAQRHWRPYARNLAEFLGSVDAAQAPGEDWDMKSKGVEKHLADALESVRADLSTTGRATVRVTGTESLPVEPPTALATTIEDVGSRFRPFRKLPGPFLIAASLVLIVVAIVGFAVVPGIVGSAGDETDPAVSSRNDRPDPVDPQGKPDAAAIDSDAEHPDAGIAAGTVPRGATKSLNDEIKAKPKVRPAKRAFLSVAADPWADVILDGKNIGDTPIQKRSIAPGRHKVVFSWSYGKITRTVHFTVKPGESKLISERRDPDEP